MPVFLFSFVWLGFFFPFFVVVFWLLLFFFFFCFLFLVCFCFCWVFFKWPVTNTRRVIIFWRFSYRFLDSVKMAIDFFQPHFKKGSLDMVSNVSDSENIRFTFPRPAYIVWIYVSPTGLRGVFYNMGLNSSQALVLAVCCWRLSAFCLLMVKLSPYGEDRSRFSLHHTIFFFFSSLCLFSLSSKFIMKQTFALSSSIQKIWFSIVPLYAVTYKIILHQKRVGNVEQFRSASKNLSYRIEPWLQRVLFDDAYPNTLTEIFMALSFLCAILTIMDQILQH